MLLRALTLKTKTCYIYIMQPVTERTESHQLLPAPLAKLKNNAAEQVSGQRERRGYRSLKHWSPLFTQLKTFLPVYHFIQDHQRKQCYLYMFISHTCHIESHINTSSRSILQSLCTAVSLCQQRSAQRQSLCQKGALEPTKTESSSELPEH